MQGDPLSQSSPEQESTGVEEPPSRPADQAAVVDRLFREHNRKLVGLLVTRLKNEQEAKEVAQEAYVKLLQLDSDLGAVSYLRAYLFRVAENIAIDRMRRRQVHAQFNRLELGEDIFEDGRAERAAIAMQELAILKRAVSELPETCREVFCLHKLAGRSIEEVTALLGLKERMVRRHLRRAMVYLCLRCEGHPAEESWRVLR